jgi:hypothetical protein
MSKADYSKALESARAEFDELVQERVGLDKRIAHLKQTIAGLMLLCDQNPPAEHPVNDSIPQLLKMTSAIRQVLTEASTPLSPPQIRDALAQRGLTRYMNRISAVHNTLLRLERQGEVMKLVGGWAITERGKLAIQMDSLDIRPVGPAGDGNQRTGQDRKNSSQKGKQT